MMTRVGWPAVAACAAWGTAYYGIKGVYQGISTAPNCAVPVAFVSGWWATLYVSAKLGTSLWSAVVLFAAYFSVFMGAALQGSDFFYSGAESMSFAGLVPLGLGQATIITSPVVVEVGVRGACQAWAYLRSR